MSTLVDAFDQAARSRRGVRFVDRNEQATFYPYESLHARAVAVTSALQVLGVRPGDHVALVLPTAPTFYDAFFGTLLAGGVPVPLYPPMRLGRMDEYHGRTARMLRACAAQMVLTDARIRRLLGVAVSQAQPPLGCHTVESLRDQGHTPRARGPDDVALLQFSSGTTVDPKPVMLTHRQILANVQAITNVLKQALPSTDVLPHNGVSWLPLYHDMGLIGAVTTALYGFNDLALIPPEVFVARPSIWLRTLSQYGGTVSPAPNFAYSLCAERIRDEEMEGVDLSHWHIALNGAEAVTPAALQRFSERFARWGLRAEAITPVYGLAEAALAVCFAPLERRFRVRSFDGSALENEGRAQPAHGGRAMVSVGQPLEGYSVRVVGDDGQPVEAGKAGGVQVRGPSVMLGYYNNPEATAAALVNGWLDTGDLGFLHDGELYLCGRRKDLIILRGRNYAPQDIEQVLDVLPGVRTGCSVAVSYLPEGANSEVLLLLVEYRADFNAKDHDRLLADVRTRVHEGFGLVPDDVVLLPPGTLPRTSSGKLRRSEALKQHLAGKLKGPGKGGVFTLVREILRSELAWQTSGRQT